jgi:type VI secretion system secreted protein Hcp
MATDIFLKIGDIKGESSDDKHPGEIEVLSWTWGVTQTDSPVTGSGTGRARFSDFSFIHHMDKASPKLMQACAVGEHLKDATLAVRKAGKGQQDYLILKMSDVVITSVQPSASGAEDTMIEHATLRCAKVDLEYKAQKADGSLDAGVHFKFDIKAHDEG